MASVSTVSPANDLARVDGKAELIQGRIVHRMPTGDLPSEAQEIFVSLRAHSKAIGKGVAKADGVGYAAKRDDYFTAGTLVVWDVDPLAETVTVYRWDNPSQPIVYRRGDIADAEPAVPGWRMAVDDIFPK